jgi:AraC-like DNA-binding protein
MADARVKPLDFRRAALRGLNIEIYTVSELRRRIGDERLRPTFRYEFHLLLAVTQGECTHLIDFRPVHCGPGSLLSIQPAQAHRFNFEQDWDGWMVVFRPEFLLSSQPLLPVSELRYGVGFDVVPQHLALEGGEFQIIKDAIDQMRKDATIEAPTEQIHSLLRHQLYALVLRLNIQYVQRQDDENPTSASLVRFRKFQRLVEDNFAKWHQVTDYAGALHCSEKSLTRAAVEASGFKAKAFIASRINLEGKRLLAQTDFTIAAISQRLGFDDTANFVKFFKRETGATPGEFRREQFEARGV